MNSNTIGDQSRAYTTRASIFRVRSDLDTLAQEVSSKKVSDIGRKLNGNLRALNTINAQLSAIDRYDKNAAEMSVLLDRKQLALNVSREVSQKLSIPLLDDSISNTPETIAVRQEEGILAFNAAVAQMNSEAAGQSLFGGLATDRPPLVSADRILDELTRITNGMNTADQVFEAVSDWFGAEQGDGGYLDFAYHGTLTDDENRRVRISDVHDIDMHGLTAADPIIRDMLKGMAMASLIKKDGLSESVSEQIKLMRQSGQVLRNNNDLLVAEAGKLGLKQETLKYSRAENQASLATLNIAHNDLTLINEEESVVKLLEASRHLSVVYEVTSRLSQLSLSEYLR